MATIAKDISLHKQMEKELEMSQNYLRELSRKSIEALESDRRTTAKELHDSIGASLAAIKLWYTRQFSKQFGNIQVKTQIETKEEDIPETLKIVIYRVLQEALHNAAKHSEATEVPIALKNGAHRIVLEVADNGCGFDVQKTLGRQDPSAGMVWPAW